MLHTNARWAFAWTFLLRLNEGSEEVPVQLKQVCMSGGEGDILKVGVLTFCMPCLNWQTFDYVSSIGRSSKAVNHQ